MIDFLSADFWPDVHRIRKALAAEYSEILGLLIRHGRLTNIDSVVCVSLAEVYVGP